MKQRLISKFVTVLVLYGGVLQAASSHSIPDFGNPGAIILDGNLALVGDNSDNTANSILVVDITQPGKEVVKERISTPGNPNSFLIYGGRLYLIDQIRDKLYSRSWPEQGEWSSIPLTAGQTDFAYGPGLYVYRDKLYVLHPTDNRIDVVDPKANRVIHQITDLDHYPEVIAFHGSTLITMSDGLNAPSCFAEGPNLSVFSVETYEKLQRIDIHGECPQDIAVIGDSLYLAAWSNSTAGVRRFQLSDFSPSGTFSLPKIGRHLVTTERGLIVQDGSDVAVLDLNLTKRCETVSFVQEPMRWIPPIEAMATSSDNRVFVTNRNNMNLVIVNDLAECR